jgi:hypothetical protein
MNTTALTKSSAATAASNMTLPIIVLGRRSRSTFQIDFMGPGNWFHSSAGKTLIGFDQPDQCFPLDGCAGVVGILLRLSPLLCHEKKKRNNSLIY